MTLEEIDKELLRLPASPTTPEDIAARAAMMQKRFEVEAAARTAAADRAAAERKQNWGLPLVAVPAGIDCVLTPNGRTVVADVVDGRRVMQLTRQELSWLSAANHRWTELNSELMSAQ